MSREDTRWRRAAEPFLFKAIERMEPDRSLARFEYRLHPRPRYGWGASPHRGLLERLAAGELGYEEMVNNLFRYEEFVQRIPRDSLTDGQVCWDNDYCGGVDALALYTSVAARAPSTYIEVGSGYSTMFARRAVEDHRLSTRIASIDPTPRANIDALCDEVIRQPLESADLAVFSGLEPGDIVVIDGTHVALMNSDAVTAFLDILPSIPAGVLVCIDDVFLPWDYPPQWTDRWYGEQYLLAAFLLGGATGWTVRFPAWYLTQHSPRRDSFNPLWQLVMPAAGKYAKSFWLERVPG